MPILFRRIAASSNKALHRTVIPLRSIAAGELGRYIEYGGTMPAMWFAKDGRRPETQRGPSIPVSYEEIKGAFGRSKPEYVSNEPPQFNIDNPSQYPVRVVIEVENADGTNAEFPKVGFYLLPGISPEEAQQLLSSYRNRR